MTRRHPHRGREVRRRLLNLARIDCRIPGRILDAIKSQTILEIRTDPNLIFLNDFEDISIDLMILIGRAIGDFPNWLLFGEQSESAIRSPEFYRVLITSLAKQDIPADKSARRWLIDMLNEDDIAPSREVDLWLLGRDKPRKELLGTLARVLQVSASDLTGSAGIDVLPEPFIDPWLASGQAPLAMRPSTLRFPLAHVSRLDHKETRRLLAASRPLNAQRIIRILGDASGVSVDHTIVARWLRGELSPSSMEMALIGEHEAGLPALRERYRSEVQAAVAVMRSANAIMIARSRLVIDIRERVAAALDAAGIVLLSAPREDRYAAIEGVGISCSEKFASENPVLTPDHIERLSKLTGHEPMWFAEGIASSHSVLG